MVLKHRPRHVTVYLAVKLDKKRRVFENYGQKMSEHSLSKYTIAVHCFAILNWDHLSLAVKHDHDMYSDQWFRSLEYISYFCKCWLHCRVEGCKIAQTWIRIRLNAVRFPAVYLLHLALTWSENYLIILKSLDGRKTFGSNGKGLLNTSFRPLGMWKRNISEIQN